MNAVEKSLKKILYIVNGIWAIPFVVCVRLIAPWYLIRFGTFSTTRIGGFVPETAHRLAENAVTKNRSIDLYWLDSPTCNDQWEAMVIRNFNVYRFVKYLARWNSFIPLGRKHHLKSTYTAQRDIFGVLERSKTKMEFTTKEEATSIKWMKEQGWREGQPFVCLQVRDSEYLKTIENDAGVNFNYHNYRDSDIDSYVPAMEWLADNGVWVFRMGKVMSKRIASNHKNVIDYAFHQKKSDLLDVWLFAKCDLCITTGTGPDMISDVYRRPLLVINYLPLRIPWSWSNALHYPKVLKWSKSGVKLTLKEYMKHSYMRSDGYSNNGISVTNMKEEEILKVVQECWGRLDNNKGFSKDELKQQQCFWSACKSTPDFSKYNNWIHPESGVSMTFLKNHPDFLATNESE